MSKLNGNEMHLLRLALKGADSEGWAKVSKLVWPFVDKLPDDLVIKRPSDDGGHVKLTDRGDAVVFYS